MSNCTWWWLYVRQLRKGLAVCLNPNRDSECRAASVEACGKIRYSKVTAMIDELGWVTFEQRRKGNSYIQ